MIRILFFVLASVVFSSTKGDKSLILQDNDAQILVKAISEIFEDALPKRVGSLYITTEGCSNKTQQSTLDKFDLINGVIQQIYSGTIQIMDFDKLNNHKRFFNLIFVEDYQSFEMICKAMTGEKYHLQGLFLVVLTQYHENVYDLVEKIIHDLWMKTIINAHVLMKSLVGNEADLYTFFPYNKKSCGEARPIIWNTFKNGSFHNKRKFFPKNLKSLKNCSLNVATFDSPPYMKIIKQRGGKISFDGLDGMLLQTLADRIHFRINLTHLSNLEEQWGKILPNGSSTGAMKLVMNGQVDLAIAQYTITTLRNKYMTPSFPYTSMPWVLIVPPGRNFTAFEKLFRPFDNTVWISILIVFVLAFGTITIIKFSFKNMRRLIFGTEITSPYLNVFQVFVEGSMHVLPSQNFARTLLMIFILYSLVLRSLYQGGLIKNMQSDDKKPPLASVEEMIEKNFNFYVTSTQMEHTEHLKIKNRSIPIFEKDFLKYNQKVHDPFFKGALAAPMDIVMNTNKRNYGDFTTEICEECLFTHQYGIYFQLNSFLVLPFNYVINHLQSNGMISYWDRKSIDKKYLKAQPALKEPRKLYLYQLAGGFIILLIGLFVACLIFAMEIFTFKCKNTL